MPRMAEETGHGKKEKERETRSSGRKRLNGKRVAERRDVCMVIL